MTPFRMGAGAIILTWPLWAWAVTVYSVPRSIAFLGAFGGALLLGLWLDCTKPRGALLP